MTSSAVEVVGEQDLSLFADINPAGQASSVVPVRWCISERMRRRLKDRKIEDAQLLVVVTNGKEETGRHLFGLFDGVRYISFTRPDDNVIRGIIVRPCPSKDLKKGFFKTLDSGGLACEAVRTRQARTEQLCAKSEAASKESGARSNLFARVAKKVEKEEESAFGIRGAFEFAQTIGSEAQLVVPVADNMFAPEPNRVWRWLSELYPWGSEPRDQCHRRQRALLTLATSPVTGPVMTLVYAACWVASLVATSVLLFFGIRNINYTPLLHPTREWPPEIWKELEPSFWFTTQGPEGKYQERKGWSGLLLFFPPICGSCGLVGLGLGALTHWLSLWAMFLVGFGFAPAFIAGILVLAALANTSGAQVLGGWLKRLGDVWVSWQEDAKLTAHERYERRLELLSCEVQSKAASLTVRRTLVLRFEGAKARVCRPYATREAN
jgi:hypothetical protein